jgi:N-terminal domain of anti-restriction factor ArdC
VKKQTAEDGRKGKTMKLEEINNKTNEAFSYLVAALESGQSEVLTQYLNAMARFHTYSSRNIMLIARQKPMATRVAGIRSWNSLGRFVKRGEKGILILAPMIGRKKRTHDIATEIETDNAADERKPEQQLYGFRAVYVFDVSQTEGKELPTLTDVDGDVTGYRERLIEYVEPKHQATLLGQNRTRKRLVLWRQNHVTCGNGASRGVLNPRA